MDAFLSFYFKVGELVLGKEVELEGRMGTWKKLGTIFSTYKNTLGSISFLAFVICWCIGEYMDALVSFYFKAGKLVGKEVGLEGGLGPGRSQEPSIVSNQ
jgi:hypothetical protein